MKTLIFAAGLGTRLKPITDTLPKALVPVCGRPLIEHVAMKLKAAGVNEAVVNVHHFADKIEDWIAGQDIMPMNVSDERAMLLETGGGILHARPYLEGCGSFLVHNVDILSDLDIGWFESQVRPDALATLLVSDRRSSRYLLFDPQTMRLAGWTNVSTGEVRSPYLEAEHVPEALAGSDGAFDPSRCLRLAFSGIHILSDKVFDVMQEYLRRAGIRHEDAGAECPLRFPIMDFYLSVCGTCNIYGVAAKELKLIDVGKLDTLEQAEKIATSLRSSQ